jgi:hypothetical protein
MHPDEQELIGGSKARGGGCQTDIRHVRVFFYINNDKAISQTYTLNGKRETVEEALKMEMGMLGLLIKNLNNEEIKWEGGGI